MLTPKDIFSKLGLSLGGLYLSEANATFLNFDGSAMDKAYTFLNDHYQCGAPLTDCNVIREVMTREHEDNHFQSAIVSPVFCFLEDLHDFYGSEFGHLSQALSASGVYEFKKPIINCYDEWRVDFPGLDRVCLVKMVQYGLLSDGIPVGYFLNSINQITYLIAYSRGRRESDCIQPVRIVSMLDPETVLGCDGCSTIAILEGLARNVELMILQNAKATQECLRDWRKRSIFGHYASVFVPLVDLCGPNIAAILMNLSLRGRFFPFSTEGEILLEDFHPALLLPRIIKFVFETYDIVAINRIPDRATFWAVVGEITHETISRFGLVNDSGGFDLNVRALGLHFEREYPEIASSASYRDYLNERARMQSLRCIYYDVVSKDPGALTERIILPDRIFMLDGVIDEDIGTHRYYPSGHDKRFHRCCFADWILFGDCESRDTLCAINNSVARGQVKAGRTQTFKSYDPYERAIRNYGIEIGF